uniref:Transmembrane protein 177 n=1 Tax=Salmo trutta TaxID=8032 RepID=A0A673XN73_SALTR
MPWCLHSEVCCDGTEVSPPHPSTYRKLYQAWNKGEPASISDKLESVFQQVLAFASFGFHPVGAGMPWLPSGAQIGIPANFNSTLDDPAGITNSTILINGKEVEWISDIGTALKDALVFSPEAQKFAMAREVARLEVGGLVLNAAVAPFCLAGVMVYRVTIKQIFRLHTGLVVFRGVVNIVALEACSLHLQEGRHLRLSWVIRMLCVCDYKQLP